MKTKFKIFKLIFIIFINLINSSKDEEIVTSSTISSDKINPVNGHESKEDEVFDGECPVININKNIQKQSTNWCPIQCLNDLDCSELPNSRCCPSECGGWKCISSNKLISSPPVHLTNEKEEIKKGEEEEEKIEEESSPINSILLRPNKENLLLKCELIKCLNPLYKCQLVELDCLTIPCPTVAKCLLNPCPKGSPMVMSNGVTALCKRTQQCWEGYWCHKIGYNGLGFCCPEPKKLSKPGNCPFKKSTPTNLYLNNKCQAKCKSDEDCFGKEEKCCFNGCGLNCFKLNNENEEIGDWKD
uniref:WAP domain-containing protein n=1 Tax=Meloidogyne enterolobii TaxID=390850 RepID=A0A6V7UV37_MELEN|nr:unnamed protein product [Meloidogyne enterolobii]